jgi:ribosomal protein L40E
MPMPAASAGDGIDGAAPPAQRELAQCTPTLCARCGAENAPRSLVCKGCHRLIHGDALRRLAADAEQATQAGDAARAIGSWRKALELVPQDSEQQTQIADRIEALASAAKATNESRPNIVGATSKHAALRALRLFVCKLRAAAKR